MFALQTVRGAIADFIAPELKTERRNLERLVNLDVLTGLANRRAYDLALPTAELSPGVAVILFDANNFGILNKLAGHAFGDVVIRDMAGVIMRAAKVYGVAERCFRIGGDEFAILCPEPIAERLRDQIEIMFGVRYPGISVSIVGTVGATQAEADATLQARKAARKGTK